MFAPPSVSVPAPVFTTLRAALPSVIRPLNVVSIPLPPIVATAAPIPAFKPPLLSVPAVPLSAPRLTLNPLRRYEALALLSFHSAFALPAFAEPNCTHETPAPVPLYTLSTSPPNPPLLPDNVITDSCVGAVVLVSTVLTVPEPVQLPVNSNRRLVPTAQ